MHIARIYQIIELSPNFNDTFSDETAINCDRFMEHNGMSLFIECLEVCCLTTQKFILNDWRKVMFSMLSLKNNFIPAHFYTLLMPISFLFYVKIGT